MNRQRLIRVLRIAWSVGFGIFCLLLIALWVRSYSGMETLRGPLDKSSSLFAQSFVGQIDLARLRQSIPPHEWQLTIIRDEQFDGGIERASQHHRTESFSRRF